MPIDCGFDEIGRKESQRYHRVDFAYAASGAGGDALGRGRSSSISSLSQRRPCAIAAISVAFVSDRIGRGRCCDGSAGRRISRRLIGEVLLQEMWSVFVPSGWLSSAASVWFNLTINRLGLISTRST